MPNEMNDTSKGRTQFRIRRKWPVAADIVGLELERVDGAKIVSPIAGAHLELVLPENDSKPIIRHYSLCNAPNEQETYLVAVKREPASRGGSSFIHEKLKEGDIVQASDPRNNFPLHVKAERHMLFAGGIGITPLLAMAQQIAHDKGRFDLYYYARSLEHVAFGDRLARIDASKSVNLCLGLSPEETESSIQRALESATEGTHVYVCGPAPFMSVVERLALAKVGTERFHFEHFGAPPVKVEGGNKAFTVELKKSGITCQVSPDQTIVQALEAAGHMVEISCEQGVCGTCLTRVLSGTPEHRDSYLNASEKAKNNQMLLCVSRSLSEKLVLDL